MLVRLYKSATVFQNIIILLVVVLLWFPRFYALATMPTDYQQPLFDFCFGMAQRFSPYLNSGITLFVLLFSAFFVQQSLNFDRLRISGHNFPLLLFVLLSATPHVAFFSPVIFTALILAVALLFLFKISETAQNDHLIFFTAFFFGISALFYPPAIFLMALFIPVSISGHLSLKKAGVALLGFLFPVIWTVSGLYLSSNLLPLLEQWKQPFSIVSLPELFSDIRSFVILSLVVIIYILIIFRILSKFSERTAIIRRRITMSCYLILLLLLSAFFSYDFYEHFALLSVPMAALISYYYNEDSESQWIDYVLFGCFIILVVSSFLPLWS